MRKPKNIGTALMEFFGRPSGDRRPSGPAPEVANVQGLGVHQERSPEEPHGTPQQQARVFPAAPNAVKVEDDRAQVLLDEAASVLAPAVTEAPINFGAQSGRPADTIDSQSGFVSNTSTALRGHSGDSGAPPDAQQFVDCPGCEYNAPVIHDESVSQTACVPARGAYIPDAINEQVQDGKQPPKTARHDVVDEYVTVLMRTQNLTGTYITEPLADILTYAVRHGECALALAVSMGSVLRTRPYLNCNHIAEEVRKGMHEDRLSVCEAWAQAWGKVDRAYAAMSRRTPGVYNPGASRAPVTACVPVQPPPGAPDPRRDNVTTRIAAAMEDGSFGGGEGEYARRTPEALQAGRHERSAPAFERAYSQFPYEEEEETASVSAEYVADTDYMQPCGSQSGYSRKSSQSHFDQGRGFRAAEVQYGEGYEYPDSWKPNSMYTSAGGRGGGNGQPYPFKGMPAHSKYLCPSVKASAAAAHAAAITDISRGGRGGGRGFNQPVAGLTPPHIEWLQSSEEFIHTGRRQLETLLGPLKCFTSTPKATFGLEVQQNAHALWVSLLKGSPCTKMAVKQQMQSDFVPARIGHLAANDWEGWLLQRPILQQNIGEQFICNVLSGSSLISSLAMVKGLVQRAMATTPALHAETTAINNELSVAASSLLAIDDSLCRLLDILDAVFIPPSILDTTTVWDAKRLTVETSSLAAFLNELIGMAFRLWGGDADKQKAEIKRKLFSSVSTALKDPVFDATVLKGAFDQIIRTFYDTPGPQDPADLKSKLASNLSYGTAALASKEARSDTRRRRDAFPAGGECTAETAALQSKALENSAQALAAMKKEMGAMQAQVNSLANTSATEKVDEQIFPPGSFTGSYAAWQGRGGGRGGFGGGGRGGGGKGGGERKRYVLGFLDIARVCKAGLLPANLKPEDLPPLHVKVGLQCPVCLLLRRIKWKREWLDTQAYFDEFKSPPWGPTSTRRIENDECIMHTIDHCPPLWEFLGQVAVDTPDNAWVIEPLPHEEGLRRIAESRRQAEDKENATQ